MVVGSFSTGCEVAIIGGGPGGTLAAIRLAQRGLDVMLVDERERLGGVCLNEGCIPSKALIHACNVLDQARHSEALGINLGEPEVDVTKLFQWKENIVERLTGGLQTLLDTNGAQRLRGRATFVDDHRLEVQTDKGRQQLTFKKALIATGSAPRALEGFAVDGERLMGSRDALSLTALPDSLLVIGAGTIGLELGTAFHRLGCKVTIADVQDRLLPALDADVVQVILRKLERQRVELLLGHRALAHDGATTTLAGPGGNPIRVEAEKILVCVGRAPQSSGLGLEAIGVDVHPSGHLVVDAQMRSSRPQIYAIGDVVPGPPLAHKAYREAEVAAQSIAGEAGACFDNQAIPTVIYTDPEIASVGLTEKKAKASGYAVVTGLFPLRASGRAMTLQLEEGLIKVVADRKTQRLLGVQIAGAQASELIGQATLAMEMGAFLDDISQTIHAHPTLSEGLQEAMHLALGRGLHVLRS